MVAHSTKKEQDVNDSCMLYPDDMEIGYLI